MKLIEIFLRLGSNRLGSLRWVRLESERQCGVLSTCAHKRGVVLCAALSLGKNEGAELAPDLEPHWEEASR
jgi:hypothetical protein